LHQMWSSQESSSSRLLLKNLPQNDHLISFIFKLHESIFENWFTFLPILKSLTISQLIWRNLSVPF
jgi:hypothetical protein